MKQIVKQYGTRNTCNADETALLFKCIPNRSLALTNNKYFGGKQNKERIPVIIGRNMTGTEKLKFSIRFF